MYLLDAPGRVEARLVARVPPDHIKYSPHKAVVHLYYDIRAEAAQAKLFLNNLEFSTPPLRFIPDNLVLTK